MKVSSRTPSYSAFEMCRISLSPWRMMADLVFAPIPRPSTMPGHDVLQRAAHLRPRRVVHGCHVEVGRMEELDEDLRVLSRAVPDDGLAEPLLPDL